MTTQNLPQNTPRTQEQIDQQNNRIAALRAAVAVFGPLDLGWTYNGLGILCYRGWQATVLDGQVVAWPETDENDRRQAATWYEMTADIDAGGTL